MPRRFQPPIVLPADKYLPNPLELNLEGFFEFQFWLAAELEQLVADHRPRHLPPEKVRGNKRPPHSVPRPTQLAPRRTR